MIPRSTFLPKTWHRFGLIAAITIALSLNLHAQTRPIKQWDKTLGGSKIEYLYGFLVSADGGYLLTGYSNSPISGDKTAPHQGDLDYWVVKTDANGNKIWDKSFGGSDWDSDVKIVQAPNGGYLLGGTSESPISGDKTQANKGATNTSDYWIVKIDANGNKIWDKTLGGLGNQRLGCIKPTSDGGYILGGSSSINGASSGDQSEPNRGNSFEDCWIIKIDSLGNKQWDKTLGGDNVDRAQDLIQTSDGGYLLLGQSWSGISADKTVPNKGESDLWLMKLAPNGVKQWEKGYGGRENDYGGKIIPTLDGGYILAGQSRSGAGMDKTQPNKDPNLLSFDIWILKINSTGTKLWDKTYGGTKDEYFGDINPTIDGGYIINSLSSSPISGDKTQALMGTDDIWNIKIDANGNKIWDQTIGGNLNEAQGICIQSPNGNYIIAGGSGSGISGDKSEASRGGFDIWLIKQNPLCSDLSASLVVECQPGGSAVKANLVGLQGNTTGYLAWVLNYTVNGTPQTATSNTPSFVLGQNPSVGTVYTLTSLTSGGCTVTLNNSLTVQPTPNAPSVSPITNCGEGSIDLSLTGAPTGGSYLLYNVATGGVPLSVSTSGILSTPYLTNSATFYVAIANNNGCESSRSSVTVTIKTKPTVTVGSAQSMCASAAPIQLTGFSPAGGVWSGPGVNATGLFTPSNSLVGSQVLTYTFTQNGCSNSATQTVHVIGVPNLNAGANQTVCYDESSFQLTGFNPSGGTFSGPGVTSSGLFTPSAALAGTQVLTYTISQNGCTVTANKQIFIPSPLSKPTISFKSPDTLIASVVGANYEWHRNGATLSTTSRKLKALSSGTYTVKVKDAYNCASPLSLDYALTISGVSEPALEAAIKIFPNPAQDYLTILLPKPKEKQEIILTNLQGQTVRSTITNNQEKVTLDLNGLATGVYLVTVRSGNSVMHGRVIHN